jgi:hypothetical protein
VRVRAVIDGCCSLVSYVWKAANTVILRTGNASLANELDQWRALRMLRRRA